MLRREREVELEIWDPETTAFYLDEQNSSHVPVLEGIADILNDEREKLISKRQDVEKIMKDVIEQDDPSSTELAERFDPHFERIADDLLHKEAAIQIIETALNTWTEGDPETRNVFVDAGLMDTDDDPYLLPHVKIETSKFILRMPYTDWQSLTEDTSLPILVASDGSRDWWLFEDTFYSSTETLAPEETLVLVKEQDAKKRRRIDRARTIASVGEDAEGPKVRRTISREVRMEVWQRDEGKCVECGSNEDLEFDHIIPHSMGGADTVRNIQLLCAKCNNEKGASI